MLLRLRVKNFKNLRDVDVRFGPLTCFTGPNGVGKSNIFDAIQFLRALAEHDIQTASQAVRSPAAGVFGPKELFWRADPTEPMSFTVDMLAPPQVTDDFGRPAAPATTPLRTRCPAYSRHQGRARGRARIAHESQGGRRARHHRIPPRRLASDSSSPRRVGRYPTKDQNRTVSLMPIRMAAVEAAVRRLRPGPSSGTNAAECPTVRRAAAIASWQLLHRAIGHVT